MSRRAQPAAPSDTWETTRQRAVALGLLPVTVTTRCGAVGRAFDDRQPHAVTMHRDGSVDTGHDVAAERVAAALGGRVTCLDLLDHTVPALRSWLAAQLRIAPPPVTSKEGRRWLPTDRALCCARSYPLVLPAVRHLRSERHAAIRHGAPVEQVTDFATVFRSRLTSALGDAGVDVLWQHGLSQEHCRGVVRELDLDEPIPLGVHLAILARKPDLTWLRPVLAEHVDRNPSLAARLVWQADRWQAIPQDERVAWLVEPIPPQVSWPLASAGVKIQQIRDLAAAESATTGWAAGIAASWLGLGAMTSADWRALSATEGGVRPAPSRALIDRTRAQHPGLAHCPGKQVAMALLRHGRAGAAAAALLGEGHSRSSRAG